MTSSLFGPKTTPSYSERIRAIFDARRNLPPPARIPDTWETTLAQVHGDLHEGEERVATHVLFDHLGLERKQRTSAAARRLAKAMRALGWRTARWQPRPGRYQRVRGFVRAAADEEQ